MTGIKRLVSFLILLVIPKLAQMFISEEVFIWFATYFWVKWEVYTHDTLIRYEFSFLGMFHPKKVGESIEYLVF